MSLWLPQIQQNCHAIKNYSFRSINITEEGTLSGFSNLNLFAKGRKMYSDWSTNDELYESLQDVVIRTLEGIEQQFNSRYGECPLYFYMDRVTKTPVTYRAIAERIFHCDTFKDREKVTRKASEFIALYDGHPFGGDSLGWTKEELTNFKGRLIKEVKDELEDRYLSRVSTSLQNVQLLTSCGLSYTLVPVPPEDAYNNYGMHKYLQNKVETLRKSIRDKWAIENSNSTQAKELEALPV